MLSDLIIALRQLRRAPVQTAIAVLTLALGIALATTFGAMLKALVLDPLNYPQPDRLVAVYYKPGWYISMPDFKDLREQSACFEALGCFTMDIYNLGERSRMAAQGVSCTSGVLQALGVRPQLGRWIESADDAPGAAPVAVLGHGIWQHAFGGDSDIIGRFVRINGQPVEVVGVMPADFEFRVDWFNEGGKECSLWLSHAAGKDNSDEDRYAHAYAGVARLREGVSLRAAGDEVKAIAARLRELYPKTNKRKSFTLIPLREEMREKTGDMGWVLSAAGITVLLLTCANVAGMVIAQGSARQREFAVRLALGAGRWHVLRLLMTESALLAAAATLLGLVLSAWATAALAGFALVPVGREGAIRVDTVMLGFAVALAFASTVLVGAPAALAARDTAAADVLRSGGRGQPGAKGRMRVLRVLIIAQIAVSLLLANSGALLFESQRKVLESNAYLATTRVLSGTLNLRGDRYAAPETWVRFAGQLVERVKTLPGVSHAAVTTKLPLEGGANAALYAGMPGKEIEISPVFRTGVTPSYFATMGLGIFRGETWRPEDHNQTAMVNRDLARQAWPDADPIGMIVKQPPSSGSDFAATVIGVVEDTRQWGSDQRALPELYMEFSARSSPIFHLVVRSSQDARPLGAALRAEVSALDPEIPLGNLRTLQTILDQSTHQRRFIVTMMGVFILCALALAAVGIYGVLSYHVADRTREIGLRMALGATRGSVFILVLRRIGGWLAAGIILGIAAVFGVSRILRAMLYEMEPINPVILLLSVALVLAAGLLAGIIPARRAMRIQPLEALRAE